MCGIAGCLIGQGPQGGNRLAQIKNIFQANLLANEQRGREATGVVVTGADGSYRFLKDALPAAAFVAQKRFAEFVASEINEQSRIILGHTRAPTKGSVADNANNHPIIVGDTVGVHNGVIANDDAIFARLDQSANPTVRIGAVDSEAIFALLNRIDSSQPLPAYTRKLQEAARQLVGSFTTLFFSTKMGATLFCLRYDNPISIHYDRGLNCLFFSSRYAFLRKAFGRAVISPGMPSRTGFVFEADKLSRQGKTPSLAFSLRQQ